MLFSRPHQLRPFQMPRTAASPGVQTGPWDRVHMGQLGGGTQMFIKTSMSLALCLFNVIPSYFTSVYCCNDCNSLCDSNNGHLSFVAAPTKFGNTSSPSSAFSWGSVLTVVSHRLLSSLPALASLNHTLIHSPPFTDGLLFIR